MNCFYVASCKTICATFSPMAYAGACVCPLLSIGIIETSATRKPSTFRTRRRLSTTPIGSVSGAILHVPPGWLQMAENDRTYSFQPFKSVGWEVVFGQGPMMTPFVPRPSINTLWPIRQPSASTATSRSLSSKAWSMIGLLVGSLDDNRTVPLARCPKRTVISVKALSPLDGTIYI